MPGVPGVPGVPGAGAQVSVGSVGGSVSDFYGPNLAALADYSTPMTPDGLPDVNTGPHPGHADHPITRGPADSLAPATRRQIGGSRVDIMRQMVTVRETV